jgi:ribosomal protein S18 acetylase RimI-like enzyme
MITIERLTEATDAAVADINRLLPQLSRQTRPMTGEILRQIITGSDQLFVARDDEHEGRIIGAAQLMINVQLVRTKSWLEDLVVDEHYRGQRIGKRLIEAVIAAARAAGTETLDLSSKPNRSGVYAMYESLGFRRRETSLFRLALLDGVADVAEEVPDYRRSAK